MTFPTIESLREALGGPQRKARDPAYVAKMMHPVPDAVVIDRAEFILSRAAGKVVLDIGASGPMHEAIVRVAKAVYGIDRPPPGCVSGGDPVTVGTEVRYGLDLDHYQTPLPAPDGVELVVCGEVIEHLSNPGWLLDRLRLNFPGVPVVITVPNAFTDIGRKSLDGDVEQVNADHCYYFSWRTLKTLVGRAGYTVREFYWYNGRPNFAEGLIFVCG